jgi:arylsulfatase A-like enzyme/tetratricopeptide (TPR) repeat protein
LGWSVIRVGAALVVMLVSSMGCSRGDGSGFRVPDGTPLVVISIDTLRSDRLPAYGYRGVETPAIDGLRRDGILFEHAYSHVPLTLPSHVSLLTGTLPPTHGVRDNLGYSVDPTKSPLLQMTLQATGYATGAAVSAFVLRRATGIAAGFDYYDDGIELEPDPNKPGIQSAQRPGNRTLEAVLPWLRSVADRPFFLFFHIFEPHSPYDPPPEFAARYESAYDGEVAAADAVVGRLLDSMRALDAYNETLIVFLSDHGEALGDHGEDEHGVFLYRSTLQVPLILKMPDSEMAGETVAGPVQLIDVYPTLVAILGLPEDARLEGTSLFSEERAETSAPPVYSETLYPRLHFGWSDLASLIVGRYHFIEAPQPELYDLLSDPDEELNLAGSKPEIVAKMRTTMSAFDRRLKAPQSTDAETQRRLRALGYLGEGTLTSDSETLPDPKDRVGVLAEIRHAHRLFADGDLESAVTAFQRIVDSEPGIEDAWEYLALAQLGQGLPRDAAATYRDALEKMPYSKRLSLRAATLFDRIGRVDEAAALARNSISYDPSAAHSLLARIALGRGDLESADSEARAALAVPGDLRPESRLVMADVLIARGEPRQAADLLSHALDEGITAESLCSKLAMIYLRIGETDRAEEVLRGHGDSNDPGILLAIAKVAMSRRKWSEARKWVERALLEAPNDAVLNLNIGIIAMAQGQLPEARTYLEDSVAGNPASFDGWNALGSVNARLGDYDRAVAAWERAHDIDPEVLDVLYNLGVAHAQAGRVSQAVSFLDDYIARARPGSQRDRALALAQQLRSHAR